jgi:hypothetical protein
MNIRELENGDKVMTLPDLKTADHHDFFVLSGRDFKYEIESGNNRLDPIIAMPKDWHDYNRPQICDGVVIPEDYWASVFCTGESWVIWIWQ